MFGRAAGLLMASRFPCVTGAAPPAAAPVPAGPPSPPRSRPRPLARLLPLFRLRPGAPAAQAAP